MSNVIIDINASTSYCVESSKLIYVTPAVGYCFYWEDSPARAVYSKTIDGGETWSNATVINEDTSAEKSKSISAFYERDGVESSPNSNIIWIATAHFLETTSRSQHLSIFTLDISDDTLTEIDEGIFTNINEFIARHINICKNSVGNVIAMLGYAFGYPKQFFNFFVSDENGENFAEVPGYFVTHDYPSSESYDLIVNSNPDNLADIILLYRDSGGRPSFAAYDTSEELLATWKRIYPTTSQESNFPQSIASIYSNPDSKIYFISATLRSGVSRFIKLYSLIGTSFVEVSEIVRYTDGTTIRDKTIALDRNNGRLYVFYAAGVDGSSEHLYYTVSSDHGVTWDTPIQVSDLIGGLSKIQVSNGIGDGKIGVVWYNTAVNGILYESIAVTSLTGWSGRTPLSPSMEWVLDAELEEEEYEAETLDIAEEIAGGRLGGGGFSGWASVGRPIPGGELGGGGSHGWGTTEDRVPQGHWVLDPDWIPREHLEEA
jgi:hypothetical protein